MPSISYIKRKIGRSWLVWFQNSNSYLQMEEPAWFVFHKITKRYKTATIAAVFSLRYGVTQEEGHNFVTDIRTETQRLNQPGQSESKFKIDSEVPENHYFPPYSVHHYRLGDRLITFSFETPDLELYLHPLLLHLKTTESNDETTLFELFTFNEQVVFRFNSEVKGAWSYDESHLVKGLIFMFLVNVIYNKTDSDWLMTVHASALTNGKKTILFSAPAGHGKTTIAALLRSKGYRLISDDFVPIEKHSFKAHPFPIAMSVKQGAMELISPLFPELEHKELNYISPEKSVRYLAPDTNASIFGAVFPVHEIVFVRYDNAVAFKFEKLDPVNGVKLLLDQAWVVPSPENAATVFEWITRLSFYQLTYSDNEKGIKAITNLFNHEQ